MKLFVLEGRFPRRAESLEEWGMMMEDLESRRVGFTELPDGVQVSTVFVGIDQRYVEGGSPLLFETMIFGGELDGECRRFTTWEEAETGHREAVEAAAAAV